VLERLVLEPLVLEYKLFARGSRGQAASVIKYQNILSGEGLGTAAEMV
jgi:hypothetical protein